MLAVLIELVTAAFRFGLGLESTRDTASTVGLLTLGLRVHHGYLGLVLLLLSAVLWRKLPVYARWTTVWGAALVLSDLVHHFVVLWIVVGDPEFHLFYPLPSESPGDWGGTGMEIAPGRQPVLASVE
jgi:hypothetical protein